MDKIGDHNDELWDEEDGFFYDVLRLARWQLYPLEGAIAGGFAVTDGSCRLPQ